MKTVADDWEGLDADELNSSGNVLLQSGRDFGLFERICDKQYAAHCLYTDTRGLAALRLSFRFLRFFFERYEVESLKGLTPVDMRGAIQLALAVGFKPIEVKTIKGRDYLLSCFPMKLKEKVLNYE